MGEGEGGKYEVNNELNWGSTPKFVTKDYVFPFFHIFLEKWLSGGAPGR